MDYPKFILSNQKEKSIRIVYKVKKVAKIRNRLKLVKKNKKPFHSGGLPYLIQIGTISMELSILYFKELPVKTSNKINKMMYLISVP